MNTLVYKDSGEIYLGENTIKNLDYWKWIGRSNKQKYMYKGYRYFEGKKENVVVYSKTQWHQGELAKRKANGFLGIKEYKL